MALCVGGCRFGVDKLAGAPGDVGGGPSVNSTGTDTSGDDDGGAPSAGAPDLSALPDLSAAPDLSPSPPPKPGPKPGPTPGLIGDACDPMNPCSTGLTCYDSFGNSKPIMQPGGVCSMDCSSAACPSGTKCIKYQGQALCFPQCDPAGANTCRMDYTCCASLAVCGPAAVCGPQGGTE